LYIVAEVYTLYLGAHHLRKPKTFSSRSVNWNPFGTLQRNGGLKRHQKETRWVYLHPSDSIRSGLPYYAGVAENLGWKPIW